MAFSIRVRGHLYDKKINDHLDFILFVHKLFLWENTYNEILEQGRGEITITETLYVECNNNNNSNNNQTQFFRQASSSNLNAFLLFIIIILIKLLNICNLVSEWEHCEHSPIIAIRHSTFIAVILTPDICSGQIQESSNGLRLHYYPRIPFTTISMI